MNVKSKVWEIVEEYGSVELQVLVSELFISELGFVSMSQLWQALTDLEDRGVIIITEDGDDTFVTLKAPKD